MLAGSIEIGGPNWFGLATSVPEEMWQLNEGFLSSKEWIT